MDDIDAAISSAELWLANPLQDGTDAAVERSSQWLDSFRQAAGVSQHAARRIGPLIGQLAGLRNRLERMEVVDWVPLDAGHIALGHRPSKQLIEDLAMQGATLVFTLLSEREGARSVEDLAIVSGLSWVWFPMVSANAPADSRIDELRSCFDQIAESVATSGRVYIHCSAGIHRTGMITYALLRYLGASTEAARGTLAALRTTTAEGVGDHRILWGETLSQLL